MAMSRAVVITFGGEGEAVEHERSGLCAPPHDPPALAAAIAHLLQDHTLRANYGAEARRRVIRTYSTAGVAVHLSQLYCELTAPRRLSTSSPRPHA